MHGLIFEELKKYVDVKCGPGAWGALLEKAGIGSKFFMVVQDYPDSEAVALVSAASELTGVPAGVILEDFGEFIVPDLLQLYKSLIRPEWKTLDLIEHTENTIHRVVRIRNVGAKPPAISCVRSSAGELVIKYASARRMCSLAIGIAKGIARHFEEEIEISQPQCMLIGATACRIVITLAQRPPS